MTSRVHNISVYNDIENIGTLGNKVVYVNRTKLILEGGRMSVEVVLDDYTPWMLKDLTNLFEAAKTGRIILTVDVLYSAMILLDARGTEMGRLEGLPLTYRVHRDDYVDSWMISGRHG